MKGKVFAFAGYSGVGKGTIVDLLKKDEALNVGVCVSATTREKRILNEATQEKEIDGKHYYFISKEEFLKMVDEGKFAEYDEHQGNYYGTLISEIEKNTDAGKNVIVEIDVNGVENLQKKGVTDCTIFISAPLDLVRERLINRGTETLDQINMRMERCEYEKSKIPQFDHEVQNLDLDTAVNEVKTIMKDCINNQE